MAPPRQLGLFQRRCGSNSKLKLDYATAMSDKLSNPLKQHASIEAQYSVAEVVGQGSMAVVHRAVQRQDGKQVALKVVRTHDEEVIAIAKAEYELLRRIEHPHIARAIDFFTTANGAVLVMSFFAGNTLASTVRRIPEKRLPEVTAHRLFVALVQALDYMHQRRIVHRDVKPDNVLVSHDLTNLQLVDFNVARHLPEGGALTPTGTPLYASPEVLQGGSPSEASDVWGAGLCLHVMLSGQLPEGYKRCKQDRLDVVTSELPLASPCWQHVSEPCKAVLRKCLTVDHSMRPAALILLETPWARLGVGIQERFDWQALVEHAACQDNTLSSTNSSTSKANLLLSSGSSTLGNLRSCSRSHSLPRLLRASCGPTKVYAEKHNFNARPGTGE